MKSTYVWVIMGTQGETSKDSARALQMTVASSSPVLFTMLFISLYLFMQLYKFLAVAISDSTLKKKCRKLQLDNPVLFWEH